MANLVDSIIKVPINLVELFRTLLEENKQSCNFFADNSACDSGIGTHRMFYNTHRNSVPQFIYDFAKNNSLQLLWRDLDGYGADSVHLYNTEKDKSYNCNCPQHEYEFWIRSKSYSSI